MMSRETPRRFLPTVRKHMKRILMMREKEGEQMEDQVEVGIGYYDQRTLFFVTAQLNPNPHKTTPT